MKRRDIHIPNWLGFLLLFSFIMVVTGLVGYSSMKENYYMQELEKLRRLSIDE